MKHTKKHISFFKTLGAAYASVFALSTIAVILLSSKLFERMPEIASANNSNVIYFMVFLSHAMPIILFGISYCLSPFANKYHKFLSAGLATTLYGLVPPTLYRLGSYSWGTTLFGQDSYTWSQFLAEYLTIIAIIGVLTWYYTAKKEKLHTSNYDPLVITAAVTIVCAFYIHAHAKVETFINNVGARSNIAEYWFVLPIIAFVVGCILFYKKMPRHWLCVGVIGASVTALVAKSLKVSSLNATLPQYYDFFVLFGIIIIIVALFYHILLQRLK